MRAGVLLQDGASVAALVAGRRRLEVLAPARGEAPGTALRAELSARRLRPGRVRLGLARSAVTVKVLELPPAVAGNLAQVLRFELERHVPFPPEEMSFDFVPLPAQRGGPVRLLVAACERRTVERALGLAGEAGLRPWSLTVACHQLPALLAPRVTARRAAWVHRMGDAAELTFLGHGRLRLSRAVAATHAAGLGEEIAASLAVLRWKDCDAVWVSGDAAGDLLEAPGLLALGAPVSAPPLSRAARALLATAPEADGGAATLALAVALGPRRPPLDLLPEALRPRLPTAGQVVTLSLALLVAALGVASLLAQGERDRRYLRDLDRAARALAAEVQTVEQVAAELGQARRLLGALRQAEAAGLRPLPLLRELTETLPQDTWLSSLSLEPRAVELTGQANTASALIPLLEASPWLERVEFTSPVTRGRDREQFRIRAGWEAGSAGPAPERPAAPAPAPRAAAGPPARGPR